MNGHAVFSDPYTAARLTGPARTPRLAMTCALSLIAAACAGDRTTVPTRYEAPEPTVRAPGPMARTAPNAKRPQARRKEDRRLTPRIVTARRKLQCVPFARRHTDIDIRGDAWTWWRAAKGRYRRGYEPRAGAVLVFKRNGRSRGHLAVVTEIIGSREIVASHANWLNRGRVHIDTPIRDVSRNNDWSAVRVWYTPSNRYGKKAYRTRGFIYPKVRTALRR